jgi:hypothetical protein
MRRTVLLYASLLLCPLAALAAAGPELRLSTVESGLSRKSAVVFDGRNFLVAWTDTLANGEIRPAAFARVDQNGLLIDRPSISTGPSYAGAPVMASDGENTLIAWLEEVEKPTLPDAPSTFDLKITWVDGDARQVRPVVRIDTFVTRTASIASASTGLGFVIAYGGEQFVNAVRLLSLSFLTSDTARVKDKTTGQGVLVASDGESAMFLWEEDERCSRPTDCPPTELHGRPFDLNLQPLLTEFEFAGERLRALISTNVAHVVATDRPTSWSITSFNRRGAVLAERTQRGSTAPALAQVVSETFVFSHRGQPSTGSDIYFFPLDSEFGLTRDLRDDQALTLAADEESEYDVSVAAAGRKVLGVYTKDEGNGNLIASRLVDSASLGSPPSTPPAPEVVRSTAGSRATVTLQWEATPGAHRYRLQVSARERNDIREIIIEGGGRIAVIDDLHTETPYEFRLVAEDANGYSSPSSILRVTTARQGSQVLTRRRAARRQ